MAEMTVTLKLYGGSLARGLICLAGAIAPYWPAGAITLVDFALHWLLWVRIQPGGRICRLCPDVEARTLLEG